VARAQQRGFVGGSMSARGHMEIGLAFASAVTELGAGRVADLGSGGGVPGLMVAAAADQPQVMLVESLRSRSQFLREAVVELGLDRASVQEARAEAVGRDPRYRGQFSAVTARGFGPPAVLAECAAPLLGPDGHLLVSEPPAGDGTRWPREALLPLGLVLVDVREGQPAIAVLQRVGPCEDRYPRRVGIPGKRPLFG